MEAPNRFVDRYLRINASFDLTSALKPNKPIAKANALEFCLSLLLCSSDIFESTGCVETAHWKFHFFRTRLGAENLPSEFEGRSHCFQTTWKDQKQHRSKPASWCHRLEWMYQRRSFVSKWISRIFVRIEVRKQHWKLKLKKQGLAR